MEESEKDAQRSKDNLRVTLQGLIAAFNRSERLPEGVHPDSIDAVKACKYTREYKLLNMSEEEKKKAERNKMSSWGHLD